MNGAQFYTSSGGSKEEQVEAVHRVPQDLLLQQGMSGGALAQGAQAALQDILGSKEELERQGWCPQQGDLQRVHHAEGCWTGCLQREEPKLHLCAEQHKSQGKTSS